MQQPRGPRPVIPDPAPGTVSGLGMIIETTLVRFMQRVINSVSYLLSEILGFGVEVFLEAIEPTVISYAGPLIDQVLQTPNLPGWFANLLRDIRSGSQQIDAIFGGQMIGQASQSGLLSFLAPVCALLELGAWYNLPVREPDPNTILSLMWRGTYDPEIAYARIQGFGYRGDLTRGLEAIARPRTGTVDLIQLMYRGEIPETSVRSELEARGYLSEDITNLIKAGRPIATAAELRELLFRGEIGAAEFQQRLEAVGYTAAQAQELYRVTWRLLQAGDVVELYRRGELGQQEAIDRLREWGYESSEALEILEVGRPLTNLGELINLYYRGELSLPQMRARFAQHGYSDEQITEFERLSHLIPNAQDLIRMAVREAFRPDLIQEYDYLAEFPSEFAEWMVKQGFDRDWAEKYWVAHWQLPSLTMAYEMFHREIIGLPDLERLFATADIAPFWRDKLRDAAYQPLTRVDVRRMYQLGVLGRTEVYKSYLHLGYSPENAEYMTQFTELYATDSDRDATKADILKAYRIGIFDATTAIEELKELRYPEEWAIFYVAFEDYKRREELIDTEIGIMEDQYIDGVLTRTDVYTQLGEYDLPSAQIENYLDMWDIKKRRQIALPTVSQLDSWLELGIITETDYREALGRRHYESDTVERFVQEIRLEIATAAQEAQEKAVQEEARIAEKLVKSEYEVTRADLDLQIAELKTAIAENMVLVGQLTDWDLIEQLLRLNEQMELSVVRLQEDKARSKLTHSQELRGFRV